MSGVKKKATYQAFETFREDLKAAAAKAKVGKLNNVLAQLRRKVEFEVTSDHIHETLSIINDCQEKNLLRFLIVRDAELGSGTSPLLIKVAANLVGEARNAIGYPVTVGMEAIQEDRLNLSAP